MPPVDGDWVPYDKDSPLSESGVVAAGQARRGLVDAQGCLLVLFVYLWEILMFFLISKYYFSPTWSTCMQCVFLGLKAMARKISRSPTSLCTECEKASLA